MSRRHIISFLTHTLFAMLIAALLSLVAAQYVYIAGCTKDGIGAWLERNASPWLVTIYCPLVKPIYKPCDWIGHGGTKYNDLFGFDVLRQEDFERLMQTNTPKALTFNYSQPWRPQFDALQCDQLSRGLWRLGMSRYGEFKHEFNDKMSLTLDRHLPSVANALALVDNFKCSMHIGIHYRAGDVFTGLDNKPNSRSMPLHFISAALDELERLIRSFGVYSIKSYMFTELSPATAQLVDKRLPKTIIMANSSDEFAHIAVASRCDVLILGHSAFSWLLSLVNPYAVILPHETGRHKYISSLHVMSSINDTETIGVAVRRFMDRCTLQFDD